MKLKSQLYLAATAISLALLASLLYGMSLLDRLESVMATQVRVGEFENIIHQMRRHEKDFLARQDLKYVAQVGHIHRQIQATLDELVADGEGVVSADDLELINLALDSYERSFIELSSQVDVIGLTMSSGLLGHLNTEAKRLTQSLHEEDHTRRYGLELRQLEKDFVLTKDLKYSDQLQAMAQALLGRLSGPDNAPERAQVKRYLASFDELVQVATKVGLTPSEGLYGEARNAAHLLESQANKLSLKIRQRVALRSSEIHYKTALLFGLMMLGVALGMIALAYRISAKTILVSQTMDKVRTSGKFCTELPDKGNDEFALIGKSFNAMMTMIRDTSQARDDALREVHESLDVNAQLLRQMEALKFAVDQHSIVTFTNPTGRITSVNDKFCEVSQYSQSELIGKPHPLLTDDESSSLHPTDLWHTIRAGNVWQGEAQSKKIDGSTYWVDATVIPFLDKNGAPEQYAVIQTNITMLRTFQETLLREKAEQKTLIDKLEQAQDQLMQADKLASLGQLSAGVAHEINNPVGYISSNITTLSKYADALMSVVAVYEATEAHIDRPPADRQQIDQVCEAADIDFLRDDVTELLAECKEGIDRVRKIVRDLKEFSHPDDGEWQQADLHKGLDSTLNIVHNEIKYNATVVKQYGQIPPVMCIPSQLNQVFMNLLVNASHSIDGSGTITLSSGFDDERVWISIADTGRGIAPEHLNKLFDPFFTTKAVGKGTGLGLSLSYGIVKKHHGSIDVSSTPGSGTTFTVTIPIQPPPVTPTEAG